jgi:hypothetical protein
MEVEGRGFSQGWRKSLMAHNLPVSGWDRTPASDHCVALRLTLTTSGFAQLQKRNTVVLDIRQPGQLAHAAAPPEFLVIQAALTQ